METVQRLQGMVLEFQDHNKRPAPKFLQFHNQLFEYKQRFRNDAKARFGGQAAMEAAIQAFKKANTINYCRPKVEEWLQGLHLSTNSHSLPVEGDSNCVSDEL
ncbi:hypothetical protein HDV03_001218 [Kappamyces sp. JEL0829]|nr:hypothetical protein HDV03_001218 [Kappamyces sp. JEL0829]